MGPQQSDVPMFRTEVAHFSLSFVFAEFFYLGLGGYAARRQALKASPTRNSEPDDASGVTLSFSP